MEATTEAAVQPTPASLRKKVTFGTPNNGPQASSGAAETSPALKSAAGHLRTSVNQLFSPGPTRPLERQDSWTIEAQRPGTMDSGGGVSVLSDSSPLYTPASAGFLESARKVDDLRGRLESLELALKDMESKAVAHLDRSLQEKVLATAAKIVQKRFLADKELDKKLEKQILKTAIKVVNRQQQEAAAAAASTQAEEEANPTRKLEFEQGEASAADVQQYVAHIEQGFGQVLRRLEKKVDTVASLLDQNALELLESRLASGLVKMESRLGVLEEAQLLQQQPAAAPGPSRQLLERVAAVEAAMAEQSQAVSDLVAALSTQGAVHSRQAAAAAAVPPQPATPASPQAADAAPAAVQEEQAEAEAAKRGTEPAAASSGPDAAQLAAPVAPRKVELAEPPQQLYQRKSAAAKRSVLGDPTRSTTADTTAAAAPRQRMPRLKPAHAAGTAQQVAMATAREALARQAQRAHEEEQQEAPVWVTMVYVFGWSILVLLGVGAALTGFVAALLKSGRLTEADLEFLWDQRPANLK